jgi:hypothetical protein
MDQKIGEMDKKPTVVITERPEFMEPLSPKRTISPKPTIQVSSKTVKLKTE